MKWLNDSKITLLLLAFVVALMLTAGSANADFTFGKPVNLGPNINSSSVEVDPSISADGLELFFESRRPGGYGAADIYVSRRASKDDPWGPCMIIGAPVNTAYLDQCPSISYDGLSLYFSSYFRTGGYGSDDLWVTTRKTKDDPWEEPVNLGATVNTSADEWMPSISADGLVLFFMSGRAGWFGGNDLWFTSRATKNAPWGSPVNLGATINSSLNEAFPDISADSRMLFFSDHMLGPFRPGGYGGQDIWITTRATTNDPWGEPMNLGPVINSSDWEFSPNISGDGSTLYFGSMPPGGTGNADLLQAPIIPIVDFNGDGIVNLKDFSKLAQYWGQNEPSVDMGPTPLGDGRVDIQDLAVFAENWLKELEQAWGPTPANGATNQARSILYWNAGETAAAHNVYFGTDRTAVENADTSSPLYIDHVVETPGVQPYSTKAVALQKASKTYYWRIDEVEADGVTIHKGDMIWSFTTAPFKAHTPIPADGATNQPKSFLYWNAGETANAHDVYFGTDRTAVENADTSSHLYIDHLVETPGVQPCSTKAVTMQQSSKTYYWRIDEVEDDGVTMLKGDVWTFTTAPLKAHSPSPADNALLVDPNTALSWSAGFTARYHDVYFGTDRTALESANTSSPLYRGRKTSPYTPGTLNKDTLYYWRVDEVESVQTIKYKGDVWQFKTILSLIAHWKLDETEGTIAHDSISNKHGTVYGNPLWQPAGGKINGALQLDGTDDYVSTPFVLNPSGGQFSAMAWVKGGSPGQVVISQQSSILVPRGKDWLCADPAGGKLMTALTDGSPSTFPLVSEFIVTDGDWHCIGVAWDGSRRRLYTDGIKVAEDPDPLANLVSCDKGLNLGAGKTLTSGTFWLGLIDDIRIYDRAVTP